MNTLKKAILVMTLPIILNIVGTVFCFQNMNVDVFRGYSAGTVLHAIFSTIWIWMAWKFYHSNVLVMIAISMGILPVKLIVFAVFAFGGLYLFHMDKFYFSVAFLLGTFLSLIIEVWYVIFVNKARLKIQKI